MGEMFRSFYDEEIGKRAAQAGGIGLSQFILSSLAQNEAPLEQRSKSLTSVKS